MDECLKFILWNLKHTVDMEAGREEKRKERVNVRFSLKDF